MKIQMLILPAIALFSHSLHADSTLALPTAPLDTRPPAIHFQPFNESHVVKKNTTVSVKVSDTSGVQSVNLYYRRKNTDLFIPLPMLLVAASGDIYTATLPWSTRENQDLEYFIEAIDMNGNRQVIRSPQAANAGPVITIDQASGLPGNKLVNKTTNKHWYPIIGGMVIAGLIYTLSRSGDDDESENGTVTIGAHAW